MAKGFKDSKGNFHPTGNSGTSSREKTTRTFDSRNVTPQIVPDREIDDDFEDEESDFVVGELTAQDLEELPVGFTVKIIDDNLRGRDSEKAMEFERKNRFNIPDQDWDLLDLENVAEKAVRETIRKLGLDTRESARFDDLGFEGGSFDLVFENVITEEGQDDSTALRLVVEPDVDPKGEFAELEGDAYDEGDAWDYVLEKLQDKFHEERLERATIRGFR